MIQYKNNSDSNIKQNVQCVNMITIFGVLFCLTLIAQSNTSTQLIL